MVENKATANNNRLLKLISVSFKEASLDSPSFRASTNFYHVQVESFESWIANVSRFYKQKFLPSMDDFKQISDAFFAQSLPPEDYLYNGLVEDQMYTPSIVKDFHKDLCDLSTELLQRVRGDPEVFLSELSKIQKEVVEPYKETRKNFDYYQSKHDTLLSKYQSTRISGSNVEPSSIREDAFQLFEARKSYLEASLDLAWEISQMQEALDVAMNAVISTLMRHRLQDSTGRDNNVEKENDLTERYLRQSRWHQQMLKNNSSLFDDMKKAKEQVQAFTIKQLQPSRDLADYSVKSINLASLAHDNENGGNVAVEKSGWLFMKTSIGKPARTTWVRRWCFVKKSVFGIFLLSSALTAVEETDKFGVLLMSVRYDANEDRKFCFEIQVAGAEPGTSTDRSNTAERMSLVFQAETLSELKSWLQVFEESKKRVLGLEKGDPEYELSFSRIPPMILEFACSSTTQTDQQLTSVDVNGLYGRSILQHTQATCSETESVVFPPDSSFQTPLLKAPISTKLTKLSILSSYYLVNDGIPNAVTANFWGSINWNEFSSNTNYTSSESKNRTFTDDLLSAKELTSPIWSPIAYPDFYPKNLRNMDLQFKSLFFSAASQRDSEKFNELLLFSFSCSWFPNSKQGFSGMCYVTAKNLYFYMNTMGFICLLNRSLSDIVSVEQVSKEDDKRVGLLKLYDMDELSLSCSVFFDDSKLIKSKLQLLLKNGTIENAKSETEILNAFASIDKEYREQKRPSLQLSNQAKSLEDRHNMFWYVDKTFHELKKRQQAFQIKFCSVYKMDFSIQPKGLMHVLFGDKSNAFPRCFLLADKTGSHNSITGWHVSTKNDLSEAVRKIHFKMGHYQTFLSPDSNGSGFQKEVGYLDMLQHIKMVKEGVYYEVDQESGYVKIPFAKPFKVVSKYIIISRSDVKRQNSKLSESTSGSCSFYIYYDVTFFNESTGTPYQKLNVVDRLVKSLALHALRYESILTRSVIQRYLDKIGKHGRVLKAIRLCGQLAVVQNSEEAASIVAGAKRSVAKYSRSSLLRFVMRSILFYTVNLIFTITRMVFYFVYTVFTNVFMLNRFVLLALLLSIIVNLSLVGKTSWSYWAVRRADKLFKAYMDIDHKPMERALYLDDVDLLSNVLANDRYECVEKFLDSSKEVESKYRQTRHEIALKRNELLVELKILNTMENEMVHGDYVSFLLNEVQNCHTVEHDMPQVWENDTRLHEHCEKCLKEYQNVQGLL